MTNLDNQKTTVLANILKTIGVSLWISFLFAGIASMLFFATFDPEILAQQATFATELSREAGYTIGFFLFWLLLVVNSSVALFLNKK